MKIYQYAVGLLGCLAITPSYSASSLIEEVVVTAQKREQNLQNVSISVTAFNNEQLDKLGVEEPTDIIAFIPNFEFQQAGANDNLSIRGISLLEFGDGNEAPVGFYVDEVYKATLGGQTVQFFDLERVEVLRGPQGTLFGRNTTGGLVHIVTRKPTDEFEASASFQTGSFDQTIVEAVVSGPLSDSVRGRLAYKFNRDHGFLNDISGNRQVGAQDGTWALRGQLDIDVTDDVSLLLSSSYSEQRFTPISGPGFGNIDTSNVLGIDPVTMFPIFGDCSVEQTQSGAPECITAFGFNNPEPQNPNSIFGPANELDDDVDLLDISAHLNWELSDNLTLTSITAYGRVERFFEEDLLGPDLFFNVGQRAALTERGFKAEQWSQELRLSGTTDTVKWVAGVYYFKDDKDDGLSADRLAPTVNFFSQQTESWAVFGQAEVSLTDALTLIAGVRYTDDQKDLDVTGFAFDFGLGVLNILDTQPSVDTDNVTWKLGLDFQLSDETLLYGNVSKGFKSGSFNTTGLTENAGAQPVGEEEVINYELGWKTTLFDGLAKFNGAFFYTDYSDLQGTQSVATSANGLTTALVTIGDAEIYGAELELTVVPTESLDLLFAAGWLESELDVSGPDVNGLDGGELSNTPQFTFSGIGIYTFSLGDLGSLQAQAAAIWKDEFNHAENGSRITQQDDFWLYDARLTWASSDEHFEVSLFGENLSDEEYTTIIFNVPQFGGGSVFAKPRTWGLKLSYNY